MISKNSLMLAEMLDGVVLPETTDVIHGLNNVSLGAFPYTGDYKNEIVQVTAGQHTDVMEQVADKLASILRQAQYEIRDIALPIAKRVADVASELTVNNHVAVNSLIDGSTNVVMMNVDDPFFNSPLYPTEVSNTMMSFRSANLGVVRRLSFDAPTDEEVLAFINTGHPEVSRILAACEDGCGLSTTAVDLTTPAKSFAAKENDGSGSLIVDFGVVQNKENLDVSRLLTMYVLITKMKTSEDPVSWLKVGSLADYREYVNLMWNGMTQYLIVLKQFCAAYASRGIVLNNVENSKLKDVNGIRVVTCDATVYYTSEALQQLIEEGFSLRELIIGSIWHKLTGTQMSWVTGADLLTNAGERQQWYNGYVSYLREEIEKNSLDLFLTQAPKVLTESIRGDSVLFPVFENLVGEKGELVETFVTREFKEALRSAHVTIRQLIKESGTDFLTASEEDRKATVLGFFLHTGFVAHFLRTTGSTLSADIVEKTNRVVSREEDNIANKRCNITVALIDVIVGLCFKQQA